MATASALPPPQSDAGTGGDAPNACVPGDPPGGPQQDLSVDPGDSFKGTLFPLDDHVDLYAVPVAADELLTIVLTYGPDPTSSGNPVRLPVVFHAELLDIDCDLVAGAFISGVNEESIVTFVEEGTYNLEVHIVGLELLPPPLLSSDDPLAGLASGPDDPRQDPWCNYGVMR